MKETIKALSLVKCRDLEGSLKEITFLTIAIQRSPDLAKAFFIQPVWHFPSSLNLCLNDILNIGVGHKNLKIF